MSTILKEWYSIVLLMNNISSNFNSFPNSATNIFSDVNLLQKILMPYKSHARYLQQAYINHHRISPQKESYWIANGQLNISQSCYIDSTGHLNAVEFNICYNQLMYYLLAECVKNKLLVAFDNWNIDDFFRHQLTNIFISKMTSSFHKIIDPTDFYGYVLFKKIFTNKKKTIFIQSECEFKDQYTGYARGEVLLAIVNSNICI